MRRAARGDYLDRLGAGRKMIDDQDISVGDVVEIEWSYDRRLGNGSGHHVGEVTHLDGGFIYVRSGMPSVGNLHMPISGIKSLKKRGAVDSPPSPISSNPFLSDQTVNPFMSAS